MEPGAFPVNDFGPVMKGLAIGGLGIIHVFLAQFAIGGGMVMCWLQWLASRHDNREARAFLDSYFRFLVLVSFVLGAITGVAMWFTSIQVSPRTIGMMVTSFHWVWAIEWTFFSLEIVSGYAFYRYGRYLDDRARQILLVLYTVGAWFSLFWINGILTWQLTPGTWLETHRVWAGFFNAGFWPSLGYRTIAALSIAALVGMLVVNIMPGMAREQRESLVHRLAVLLTPMVLMPLLGWWYVATMPPDSRAWATGGSVAITMFLSIAAGMSAIVGVYSLVALWYGQLYVNGATSALLLVLALGATGGGEFVREGVRKPFTIRETLYSNGILRTEAAGLRQTGLSALPLLFPLREANRYPGRQLQTGALVFREQCSVCHTLGGVNALDELTHTWTLDQMRMNIAQLQRTKPFMPPFCGTADEVEALVQMLEWVRAGRPPEWPDSRSVPDYGTVRNRIQAWLDEAGTDPASPLERTSGIRSRSAAR